MNHLLIRAESPADASAVRAVHDAAFPGGPESRLVDVLRDEGVLCISLVATAGDQVIGHVAFSPVTVDGDFEGRGLGLAPVAVQPDYQRRGIGSRLIRAGLEACREDDVDFVVLLGDPAFYQRFGFTPAPRWGLSDAYGGGDAFQVIELSERGAPRGAGLVRYAPAFGMFE